MLNWPIVNRVSYIPVVFVRARKTSASMGVYVGPQIRVTSSKKLVFSSQQSIWGSLLDSRMVGHILRRRIHQIELALMFHDVGDTWVFPYTDDTLAHMRVQRRMRIRVHDVFQKEFRIIIVLRIDRADIKLGHGSNESLDAIEYIFVDGEAVEPEFLWGVAVLMDNFHLLHDCRLAAFSGTCQDAVST